MLRAKGRRVFAGIPRAIALITVLLGCSSQRAPRQTVPDAAPDAPSVALGMPGGDDGLEFFPFGADQVLNLETFGQGGTHVSLAARTRGFGKRAYAAFSVENLETGVTLVMPAPTRPQLFYCHEDVCDLLPVTMMMGGIAAPDAERNDLPITVTVEVHTDEGVAASASEDARLSTADLGVAGAGP
jgi:hypothetical protein